MSDCCDESSQHPRKILEAKGQKIVAGLLLLVASLGFLPRFSFLSDIVDPTLCMGGVFWYILFSGCLWRSAYATESKLEDPTSCFNSAVEQLQDIAEDGFQEPVLHDPDYCYLDVAESSEDMDETELHDDLQESLPHQAEFDWVSAARNGEAILTEDVYRAAIQWWLEHQHQERLDWLSPQDQRLLRPVVSSSSDCGDVDKAYLLLEKIGLLDRMERDLQRFGAQPSSCTSSMTPLARTPLSPTAAAAQLRMAIEAHVPPMREASSELPHWHMSWKYNRKPLAEHLFGSSGAPKPPALDDSVSDHCSSPNVLVEDGISSLVGFAGLGA
jgi:hypothetical protein